MKTSLARVLPSSPQLLADDSAEEISSIRHVAFHDLDVDIDPSAMEGVLDLEMGVEIDVRTFDRSFGDPSPVYARPYNLVDGHRCQFQRGYFLGTRFQEGIIESASWEREMRDAGLSDAVLAECRRYLADNAM